MQVALIAHDAEGAMSFGSHVDNAVRANTRWCRLRADGRVFDALHLIARGLRRRRVGGGGHLWCHAVKLPAGDMIIYPGDSVHHVKPVTRGSRIASFFWTQSMVRDTTHRRLLFDLDMSIMRLNADHLEHPSLVSLTSLYHNLLRQWCEL